MSSEVIETYAFGSSGLTDLRDALASGSFDPVVSLFESAGAQAPLVIWRPGPANLRHPLLNRMYSAALSYQDHRGRTSDSFADSEDFAALSAYAMLLEPVRGGQDFRYLHYGSEIAGSYGRDLTGDVTGAIGGHVSLFFIALYQAVQRRGDLVKSVHEPPEQVFVRKWRRLLVPLYDSAGTLTRIAAVNVPDNDLRAGLDALPDPVMVVSASEEVVFGNRAACRMFGAGGMAQPAGQLEDVLGTQVDLGASPESLVRQGALHERRKALVRDSILIPVRLTIGATFYRQTPFYIVTIQPQG